MDSTYSEYSRKGPNPSDTSRIKRITQSIIGLPTLPTVISKMLEMIDNPRTSATTLARLISTDQSLTAKILKLANSAYYGFSREISTVNMAIVVLGFNTVKEMGLWLSVFDVFKRASNSSGDFDAASFWEHSVACGVAARMIARTNQSRFAAEAFVAGLLHDIGKIILNQYFNAEFNQVLNRAEQCSFEEAEKEVIGTTHGRIGAWLTEKWNLPSIISQTILHHHTPWNAGADKHFVAMVTLGDLICHLTSIGNSGRFSAPPYDERLWNIFMKAGIGVDEPDLERLQTDFLAEYDRSEVFLSLIHDSAERRNV
ncbi:HDOD domain-containing protein [Chitinispirillales bacterium ANBcel5]|uniref:HDOD domain-containing protein n=1 Tax=Cellulosispirillum alkaliphilum TaxID=3039283 RepID=UPI002A519D52|nr:HDOD domain-containing protein [Chitinispirillales bacterium ANBcel5]